jgi:hypothetical protein
VQFALVAGSDVRFNQAAVSGSGAPGIGNGELGTEGQRYRAAMLLAWRSSSRTRMKPAGMGQSSTPSKTGAAISLTLSFTMLL